MTGNEIWNKATHGSTIRELTTEITSSYIATSHKNDQLQLANLGQILNSNKINLTVHTTGLHPTDTGSTMLCPLLKGDHKVNKLGRC